MWPFKKEPKTVTIWKFKDFNTSEELENFQKINDAIIERFVIKDNIVDNKVVARFYYQCEIRGNEK